MNANLDFIPVCVNGKIINSQEDYDSYSNYLKNDDHIKCSSYKTEQMIYETWISTYEMKKITGECGC